MGEEIVSHHPEFSHSMPKGQRYILYVMTEIEEQLAQFYGDVESMLVANISFAYSNQTLLHLLKDRGDALKWHSNAQLKKINKQITRLVHNRMGKLTTPVHAFVTFE
jgi:hypothetical protein